MPWAQAYRQKFTSLPKGASRWLLLVGALSSVLIGLGLLVLMTQATDQSENFNQNYEWLVITNAVVAGGLLITILWGAVRLWLRLRQGQFLRPRHRVSQWRRPSADRRSWRGAGFP